ncbi:multiple inositol polyphosphate phosphatase 1-like [Bradysia coprophila]|nr:multiple inositol polyphosphate phosphatase 1-like [Bradysia coprophila]
MFTIHGPYEPIRGQRINANVSTCTPSKFWMLGRYGTRLPSSTETANMLGNYERLHTEILENYKQGKTSLCAADFELLENWELNPDIALERAAHLTSVGWDEYEWLAQRYQAAFPTLLPSTYSPSDYFFRSSGLNNAARSLYAFADGLFGTGGHESVEFADVPEVDYLLLPHIQCPLYQDVIFSDRREPEAFRQGPEYQQMAIQVSAKLGFHASQVLRINEIDILASFCKYEQIWYLNGTSPYCAGFSIANHQVYEYYWDLDLYYRFGYGHPNYRRLLENMNCFLMQDLLTAIQSNNDGDHKARIFNTNNITLILFLLHFGVYEDDTPLTRHNFAQQTNRLWKSSFIIPMAANLAIVKYDCANEDNDILFLLNENPLHIPGCEANGLCKQSLLLERFGRFLTANCMETFCTNSFNDS